MRALLATIVSAILVSSSFTTSAATPEPEPPPPDPRAPNTRPADPELGGTTTGDGFRTETTDDSIGAEVFTPEHGGSNGPVSFSSPTRPRCTHRAATYGEYPNVVSADASVGIPDPAAQVNRDNNGRAETGWVRECAGGGAQDPFYWAPAAIDPIDLVPNALANARTQLSAPDPAINPDANAGGIVNLGMWLAVNDPGTTTARASLANVWAQVDANVAGISVDLGNGDTVDCDGLGTPIPDWAWEEPEQGPCGYTYRASSPDDDPYQLTITTNYAVTYRTSNGQTGTLAPIARSATIDYDVDEIQTVGVSN